MQPHLQDDKQFEETLAVEAKKFEENLVATTADPLERVKKRHVFYTKQEESRVERLRAIGQLLKKKRERSGSRTKRPIQNRTFEAGFANKQYHGTIINEAILQEQENMNDIVKKQKTTKGYKPNKPVFLGEDGTLYDINYIPIHADEQVLKNKRGKLSQIMSNEPQTANNNSMESLYEYCHDPELYQTPPSAHSFQSFEEYEEALVLWANDVQRKLGYLQLPRIMGRHYYRPYVASNNQANASSNFGAQADDEPHIANMDADETWESNLVPLEPKPEFYSTYEEYEKALIRWSIICYSLPFLPPHPAQFQKLLGVKLSRTPAYPVPDIDLSKDFQRFDKERKEDSLGKKKVDITEHKTNILADIGPTDQWDKLKPDNQNKVKSAFQKALELRLASRKNNSPFQTKLMPKIHGTFEEDTKLMKGISLDDLQLQFKGNNKDEPSNVREWVVYQRQERSLSSVFASNTLPYYQAIAEDLKHQIALRRLDLSDGELKATNDCEEYEQGKPVIFKIPDFDIGQIDFYMLEKYPVSYIRFLQVLLTRMDYAKRYSDLTSWYYPKIPQQRHLDDMKELCAMVPDKMATDPLKLVTPLVLKNIFLTNALLDTFAKWLQKDFVAKGINYSCRGETVTLKQYKTSLFCAQIGEDGKITNFLQILNLLKSSNSKLVHAKVSEFMLQFMKTRTAELVLQYLLKNINTNIENLYYVAIAVSFYDEVPVNIFFYDKETKDMIKQTLGDKIDTLISNIVTIYYLDCMGISLLEEDKSYGHVYPMLVKEIEKLTCSVSETLKEDNKFLSTFVWHLLGHRSTKFSHLGYVLLSFLFNLSYNPIIYELMKSPNTRLVEMIRKLAASKFTHVRQAIARIFPTLTQKKWQQLLTQTYSDASYVVSDLVVSAERTILDSQPPLISSMVLDFMIEALTVRDITTVHILNMIKGLIESKAFNKTLMEVLKTCHQKRMHQGTIMGAVFLAKFAKLLTCHKMIGTATSQPAPQKKSAWTIASGILRTKVNKSKSNAAELPQQESPFNDFGGDSEMDSLDVDVTYGMDERVSARLEVTYDQVVQILDLVCSETNMTNKRRAYRPRMYMLECLRHLLKCPDVWDHLKKDHNVVFTRVLDICKDGTDMEFNRNAWRLFYQLIKFHAGVLESLIKNNRIINFLELIGSGASSVVITNSLHYFNKIFNLPLDTNWLQQQVQQYAQIHNLQLPQAQNQFNPYSLNNNPMFNPTKRNNSDYAKLQYGKKTDDDSEEAEQKKRQRLQSKRGFNVPSDDVQKQYDKSVKTLTEFIASKQLFFIFHNAYKKLNENYAGWPFQSLVSLYDTLNNHTSCNKLVQSYRKVPDYAVGHKKILDMIGSSDKKNVD